MSVTPVAGLASTVTTGGTAVNAAGTNPNGGFITNPASATETLFVNPVGAAGTSASGTSYAITSTHTYTNFGTFPVSVTINSAGGSSAVAQGSAIVTDSPTCTGRVKRTRSRP